MVKITLLIFSLSVYSCNISNDRISASEEHTNNIELVRIFNEDQSDRRNGVLNWEVVSGNDLERQQRVYELMDSNKVVTSLDFYHAAMIFQHGNDTISSSLAVKLMRKCIELDSTADKWLLAAAIDRDLMRRDQPQIYGTQFIKPNAEDPWTLYKMDTTKITDEERIEFGVERLSELKSKEDQLNEKKLH